MSKELLLTSGNKLLMNLAKTAKEMYLILLNNESFVNNLDNETLLSKPGNRTLLNIIQSDIYNNVKPKTGKSINASLINDGSLSVVSNYTPMREVEVLYNYLLKQIETNGYKPNDFIVMTSNIDTYTPYIKAVFDNSPVKLPYTIADRSYVGTDNLVGILKQILLLQKDEFTSENVMQILEFDEVKNKFDIKNLFLVR
jgi:exodeoxyribonuclease V gamma subunit